VRNTIFILTINNHPILGSMLIPFLAEVEPDGKLHVVENATVSTIGERFFTDKEKKIISIAKRCTESELMKVFSRSKILADFFNKLTEKTLKESIRPFVEKKNNEIVEIINKENIPLYIRDTGADFLYEHHRIDIHEGDVDVNFLFEMNESYFRYSLNCQYEGKQIVLQKVKPFHVLVSSPAVFVLGKDLYSFDKLSVGRIIPFLERKTVEARVSEAKRYFDAVVVPLMREYTVSAVGFNIIKERVEHVAELKCLSLVVEGAGMELLFRYGTKSFFPGQELCKTYPHTEETDGVLSIKYFKRNLAWEKRCVQRLRSLGLIHKGEKLFLCEGITTEYDAIDWVRKHRDELLDLFSVKYADYDYYIGGISIKHSIDDTPDWFEVKITVQIGDYKYPFVRFRKNIQTGNRRFVLPDGKIALLPEEWFEMYAGLFAFSEVNHDKIILKKIHLGVLAGIEELGSVVSRSDYVMKEQKKVPPHIKAALRNYQHDGFSWLVHIVSNGFGGCLADDMGLGKTLQTITLLQYFYDKSEPPKYNPSYALPVEITSDETGQFSFFENLAHKDNTPEQCLNEVEEEKTEPASLIVMPTSLLPNWKREIQKFSSLSVYEYSGDNRSKKALQRFKRFNIVLITYGLLRRDIDILEDYNFKFIIVDESQYIKNPASIIYHSVLRLKGENRFVLTGTPIENSLKDLWAQFNFINPGLLGTVTNFRERFINPITKEGNQLAKERLLQLIRPFFLRRTKRQVAPELPELTEEVVYCEMSVDQKEVYKKEKNTLRNSLLKEWSKNRILALNGILRLRQLACHPGMLYDDYKGESGKTQQIIDAYEILQSEGHKVLIFSSFVTHLNLIAAEFDKRGWQYAMLTGSTLEREKEIQRFNENEDVSAFFISLKAGGVGLNLTEADYVFIIDPWWNPAAEMQAESRAHRIGQNKQVFVFRFISADTIEEKIRVLQEHKSSLADDLIKENDPLQIISDEEWKELLR